MTRHETAKIPPGASNRGTYRAPPRRVDTSNISDGGMVVTICFDWGASLP